MMSENKEFKLYIDKLIKESISAILESYKYKNHDKNRKVAQYLNGKSSEEMRKEWSDILAKRAAIADINKDRDWEHMSPHDRQFSHTINYETFNTNFDDLDDYDYLTFDDKDLMN